MNDILALIAERKILEAMENGLFNDLPGKGRPIRRDDDVSGVPEDLRMAYKILKNAGYLPPELELRREMLTLRDLLQACTDDEQRVSMQRRLALATLHYNVLVEKNRTNSAFPQYAGGIARRLMG